MLSQSLLYSFFSRVNHILKQVTDSNLYIGKRRTNLQFLRKMGADLSTSSNNDDLKIKKVNGIKFHLQDQEHLAKSDDITPNTSLNFYLRNIAHMTGTKALCLEGGCGACTVVLQNTDPITKKNVFLAVNSCLIPLLSCNGWWIITIEGIGNAVDGYHPLQEVLAQFNGTQCGFCSPGMVMNMYALFESGKMTMEQVENSFSGNLCRCTGYRPILSAFKSLCQDATTEILGECPDLEDFVVCYKEKCAQKCINYTKKEPFYLEFEAAKWIRVHTLTDLLRTLGLFPKATYKLVAGNTAQGVYTSYKDEVQLYIDVTEVLELTEPRVQGNNCVLGANITLTDTIEFFTKVAKDRSDFIYLKAMADHIDLVANVPVRNRGTIAGNLMIKHDYHDFPSDIFLILEAVGAKVTVVNVSGQETELSPLQFINYEIRKKRMVLKTITLAAFPDTAKYISYKIMPRAQSTHAIVNSGFLFQFDTSNVLQKATIVFGNINSTFVHATVTENFLKGKNLFDNNTLKQAYESLQSELSPSLIPPEPLPKTRKQLAIALFYKAVLNIAPPDKVSPRNTSGGKVLIRGLSNGTQDYETNKSLYPLTQAIPKIEALAQTTGEAQYVADIPDLPFQLYGALVLAGAPPNSTVTETNATKALAEKDIVAFYGKDDIPGENIFTPISTLTTSEEELFCSGTVKYYEQPVGILVGTSQKAVEDAVDLVKITYEFSNAEPVLTIRQALKENRTDKIQQYKTITPSSKGEDIKHVIKGKFDIYQQYHFHMETQCCQVVPNEDGLYVYSSCQWMDIMQVAISRVLNIPQNKVNVIVRRCGGSFGAKISRANLVACSAALAAWKLKKPVKLWLPLSTNMAVVGKRFPLSTDYEVGVNDKGVIQYLNCSQYTDTGYQHVEDVTDWFVQLFMTIYRSDTFKMSISRVLTDTHVNTWMRAPGSTEALASLESIMEHISYDLGLDPIKVRSVNLSDKTPAAKYLSDIKSWADIDNRRSAIATFNKENRWKKKGLAVVPMSFDMLLIGPYLVTISIFHNDGSVQISHGGVEIGQGINTKAVQVCAYKFGIPIEKVSVLPSNTFASANSTATGSSITSDGVCYSVIQACEELLASMKPYWTEGITWEDLVKKCHASYVKLMATGLYYPDSSGVHPYSVYGVCATEVEVDILTGQHLVTRVDLIEDTGVSLSPIVDIGQVEGAFITGLGYNTTEKIVFNYEGKLLTNNTWTYYPPGAKDIPVQFNVKFPKNNPNPVGVLKSKGTGEPAMSLGITISFAIRNALASARKDAGPSNSKWYFIDGPTDVENVILNSLNNSSQFVL